MTKVVLTRYEDDSTAFCGGEVGAPHFFEQDDEDSLTVAFTKAVNDIIERREEVEGEAAVQVAEVLKAGEPAWPAGSGYTDLIEAVTDALPKGNVNGKSPSGMYAECSPYYVQDVSLDSKHALVCGYVDGDEQNWVVPFTLHDDGSVVVGDKSAWVEVAREFVAKAGRMFSARNLTALQEAHEALAKLIERGIIKPLAVDGGEEETQKAGGSFAYTVEKTDAAMRYTLGPLYAPMREDAHGDWIEDDALHKALHEFVRDSADTGRRINLQHGEKGDVQCGEWVECVRWPYEHTIKMTNAKGEQHDVDMPAGTVYLGVVWDEDYWDVEKSAPKGLDGYSLGGRAMKVKGTSETLKEMGYRVKKSEAPAPVEKEAPVAPEPPAPAPVPAATATDDVEIAAMLAKERAEREAAQGENERTRGLVERAFSVFEKTTEAKPGDVHVHLPEQNVTINDAPLEPEAD